MVDRTRPLHAGRGEDAFHIAPGDGAGFGRYARFLERAPRKKRLWRKRFAFLILFGLFWITAVGLTIGVIEGL